MTVGQIVRRIGVSQATVSHHLRLLAEERFVLSERRGNRTYCRVNPRCLSLFPDAARKVIGSPVEVRPARALDLAAVKLLLASNGLPLVGVESNLDDTLVADHDERVVGCGAIEYHGTSALLRSIAVADDRRGRGIGRQLVTELVARAAPRVREIVLLTESASSFFARFGFRVVDRQVVPEAVRASAEFAQACPANALAMMVETAIAAGR
jgi:amino-acid N-acetyltransferase